MSTTATTTESTSNAGPNAGPGLLGGCWTAAAVATIVVILRVIAKVKIHQFRIDDIAMITALVLAIISSCCLTIAVQHGFGRPVQELQFSDRVTAVEFYILHQDITVLSTAIGRVAFVAYLWVILGGQKLHRVIFGIIIALQLIINLLSVIFIFVQCQDVRTLWNPTISSNCWSVWGQIRYAYFQCSFNTATDLYLSVFPAYFFWSLNLKVRIKISLIILLSLGLVAMVASLIKTIHLPEISYFSDPTYTPVNLARWGFVETYVVIITASIPCIRSLVVSSIKVLTSNNKSSNDRTYELSSRYTAKSARKSVVPSMNRRRPDSKLHGTHHTRHNDPENGSMDHILEFENDRNIMKQVDITVEIEDAPASV